MKRLIVLIALLWGAAGCEVSDGGGTFQPTRPGYYLFRKSYEPLCSMADELCDIFAFARYCAAATDEEREALHDAFFYTKRITRNGDTWRIISTWEEMEIATGGLPLQAEGSSWTVGYPKGYCGQPGALTIGRDPSAEDRYALRLPGDFGSFAGCFTVGTPFLTRLLNPGNCTVELSIAGEGHADASDVGIDFTIRTPLRYNSSSGFIAGALQLTAGEADEAAALLEGCDRVKIEYNGYNATWNRDSWWVEAE